MFRLITVLMLQLHSSIYKFLTKYVSLLLPPRDRQKSGCSNGTKAWNILHARQWRNYAKWAEEWSSDCATAGDWERQNWKLTAFQICNEDSKAKTKKGIQTDDKKCPCQNTLNLSFVLHTTKEGRNNNWISFTRKGATFRKKFVEGDSDCTASTNRIDGWGKYYGLR